MNLPKNGIETLIVVGSGNVATHLSLAFMQAGVSISQVYSRSPQHAATLAGIVGSPCTSDPASVMKNSDAMLLALSDSAVIPFLEQFGNTNQLLIHTSGSLSLEVLGKYSVHTAVMYPLQTFSREVPLELGKVPFLIEGSCNEDLNAVENLAGKITRKLVHCNSSDRLKYHLAAVFCNNFSNQMMAISENILSHYHLSFEYLHELIKETSRKAILTGPSKAQTGPARRGNEELVQLHRRLLNDFPDFQKIYTFVSDSIRELHASPNTDLNE